MKNKPQAPRRDKYGKRLHNRKVRKLVLAILIVVTVLIALSISAFILLCAVDRLTLIRWTINANLPEWFKAFLWGWY